MANDNQANYARIGFFIIVGIALILTTLVWLGGFGGNKNEFLVETFFSNPVSGLDVGSAVNLRGVRVGSVKRISFVGAEYDVTMPEDGRKIYVLLALDRRLFRLNHVESPERMLEAFVSIGCHRNHALFVRAVLLARGLGFPFALPKLGQMSASGHPSQSGFCARQVSRPK